MRAPERGCLLLWTWRVELGKGQGAAFLPQDWVSQQGLPLAIKSGLQASPQWGRGLCRAPWAPWPVPGPAPMRVSPPWGALQADTHTQFREQARFLQLQALSTADSGDYSCTARNAAGSTSVAFRVDIHSEWARPSPAHPQSRRLPEPAPLCPSCSGAHHPAGTPSGERLREPDGPAALPGGWGSPTPRELAEGRGPPGCREPQVRAERGGSRVSLCTWSPETRLGSWSRREHDSGHGSSRNPAMGVCIC